MKEPTLKQQRDKIIRDTYVEMEGKHDLAHSAFKVSREINTFLEDAREQGFHDMGKLNKMAAQQIANQAMVYEDKDFLDFIYEIKTYGDSNYGQTVEGQTLIRTVGDQIDTKLDENERKEWDNYKRRREQNVEAIDIQIGKFKADNEGGKHNNAIEELYKQLEKSGRHGLAYTYRKRDRDLANGAEADKKVSLGGDNSGMLETLETAYKEGGAENYYKTKLDLGISVDSEAERTILNSQRKPRVMLGGTEQFKTQKSSTLKQLMVPSGQAPDLIGKLKQDLQGAAPKVPTAYFQMIDTVTGNIEKEAQELYYKIHNMVSDDNTKQYRAGYAYWHPDQHDAFNRGLAEISKRHVDNAVPLLAGIMTEHRGAMESVNDWRTSTKLGLRGFRETIRIFTGKTVRSDAVINPYEVEKLYLQAKRDMQLGAVPTFMGFEVYNDKTAREMQTKAGLDPTNWTVDTPLEEFLERRVRIDRSLPDIELYEDKDNIPIIKMYLQHIEDQIRYEKEQWDKSQGKTKEDK